LNIFFKKEVRLSAIEMADMEKIQATAINIYDVIVCWN